MLTGKTPSILVGRDKPIISPRDPDSLAAQPFSSAGVRVRSGSDEPNLYRCKRAAGSGSNHRPFCCEFFQCEFWDATHAHLASQWRVFSIISPQIGAVRSSSATVTPTQTTTYTLYATNQYGRTQATVTVTVQ